MFVRLSWWYIIKQRIEIYLDENGNDLDFEDPIDKNHASPTPSNESSRTPLSKQSLLCSFSRQFIIWFVGIDRLAFGDHAAMAIDFKGEGLYI